MIYFCHLVTKKNIQCHLFGNRSLKPKVKSFFHCWPEKVFSFFCILTLDRAVNQIFSAQDVAVKISGSSHVVDRKSVDVTKWYMQMPTWEFRSKCESSVQAYSNQSSKQIQNLRPPDEDRLSTSRLITQNGPLWASGWVSSAWDAAEVLSGALKKTHGMVKRKRTYGPI